ncbi:MAG: helix-turn-helix transcriptional regulator [Rhizobiales bacterium]|nr:helix-turn-helix transcriptional regulator [Hyphomicrobiales bacterium]
MTVKINRTFVQTLLAARGMTSRDLARETGLGEATVYNIMAGKGFTSDTLGQIATALNVTPSALISTSEVEVSLSRE